VIFEDFTRRARIAGDALAGSTLEARNLFLYYAASKLLEYSTQILAANAHDVAAAIKAGAADAFIDRLKLNDARIESMANGMQAISVLPDPVGRSIREWQCANGLRFKQISVPIGVIGVIYESRPNVTADVSALCVKSGNAVILRGGSESLQSSLVIVSVIRDALKMTNLPEDAVQMAPDAGREFVSDMLGAVGGIDVIIPRGGKSLTEKVMKESRVPTILHLDGNCHVYIHVEADLEKAVKVVENSKMRRTGVCGAAESLLIDEGIAQSFAPELFKALSQRGCVIRADEPLRKIYPDAETATESDWSTEYLAPVISAKIVSGVEEAVQHINKYGSHHTDAIMTESESAASYFLAKVDSAIVLHNASTQFADGGEFGFGGEVGIATGRLHARGPVGLEQLTTYKYQVIGDGHIRAG